MRALFFICSLIFSLNLQAASEELKHKEDEILLIKSFYNSYIAAACKLPDDVKSIEVIKTKFLTKRFLKELNSSELDYDPFLDAQDCKEDWVKTLKVISDDSKNNYIACYKYQDSLRCVRLFLTKQDKYYKINNVEYIRVIPVS